VDVDDIRLAVALGRAEPEIAGRLERDEAEDVPFIRGWLLRRGRRR
jgi:hypothetical protein